MYDYAWVHIVYTIPPAVLLTFILWPLFTKLDVYKICFLVIVAFTYTIPWDSYLIKSRVWTYPPDSVLGPTLLEVPAEELFFFVIQTYITTCLHILLNKSTLPATYIRNESATSDDASTLDLLSRKRLGQAFFAFCIGVPLLSDDGRREGTYMKLIAVWAAPVLLLLWSLSYQLILTLPRTKVLLPIALPTLYLWIVDTLALQRGTWAIESGTKLGICVWPHLEVEEAVFFLVTNTLVVWGSCAFDNAVGVLDIFPSLYPASASVPSPIMLVKSLLLPVSEYDTARLEGLRNSLTVLAKKSRSFYLASGVFSGRLRIDLVLLYAFCRVADDLIDDAPNAEEADKWIRNVSRFLDAVCSKKRNEEKIEEALTPFPSTAQSILKLLPVDKLPSKPLYSLLDGFRQDLGFLRGGKNTGGPVKTTADLEHYANCVAATIGELCLSLVYYHDPNSINGEPPGRAKCVEAGGRMGRALQYVNITRDVTTDAEVGRCYIPEDWFSTKDADKSPNEFRDEVLRHRRRILNMAFTIYAENRNAIEELPPYARDGIRVAVESYMEIGRVLQERVRNGQPLDFGGGGKQGRASVPRSRRIVVGWRAMAGWRGSTDVLE